MNYPEPTGSDILIFFREISTAIPFLVPMMLLGIFLVISLTGYSIQRKKEYSASLGIWFLVSGFIVGSSSVYLFVVGLLTWYYMGIIVVLEAIFILTAFVGSAVTKKTD